ncbi:MAG: beta-propeller domain-containing protein [Candidatus Falkowbacteria bacterium]
MQNSFGPKKIVLFFILLVMVGSFAFLKIKQTMDSNRSAGNSINNIKNASSTPDNSAMINKISGDSKMLKFNNGEELKAFLEANANGGGSMANGNGGIAGGVMIKNSLAPTASAGSVGEMVTKDTVTGAPDAPGTGLGGAGTTPNYSATNVQVAGVDEADIVKTDGNYIYVVSGQSLFIVKAYPGEQAEIVSKITFANQPQDIYINGDSLTVFGYDNRLYATPMYKTFIRQNQYTFFKVFDISDKKNPKQTRNLDFEGNYLDSRQIGDYVYFFVNNYNYYTSADPVLPRVLDGDQVLSDKCASDKTKCFAPNIYYFDMPYNSYNFTTIVAVNTKKADEPISGDIYLMDSGQNSYVSEKNIYITNTRYLNEYDIETALAREIIYPRLSAGDQNKITRIEAAEDYVLNRYEKQSKVAQIIDRFVTSLSKDDQDKYNAELEQKLRQKYIALAKDMEKTIVYKIAIDNGKLEYKTSGEVTGSVLNQFSMDENGDYFRIATTRNQTWSRFPDLNSNSYNNLYVLGADLKIVGSLENLAPNERIFSARFMGNRAYLTTFKQTDPLFAIDLTTPSNPQILGELKVPGFSNYLHPYDENMLIGFGKDAIDMGDKGVKVGGLKLSLFDVRDIKNPKVLDEYTVGDVGSDSVALFEHKAFLFSKEKNLLVLPVSLRKSAGLDMWGDITFNGAMVWQIKNDKFELQGKIDHNDGKSVNKVDYFYGYGYYDSSVKRSLYINDKLYTVSDKFLKINNLSDLKEVKSLELQKTSKSDFQVVN